MSINFKFSGWFSPSDSIWKEWTYLYSQNINTLNPEYIQVSPKLKNIYTTTEKIDYLVPKDMVHSDFFHYVRGKYIYDWLKNQVLYEHWLWFDEKPSDDKNLITFAYSTSENSFILSAYWTSERKMPDESIKKSLNWWFKFLEIIVDSNREDPRKNIWQESQVSGFQKTKSEDFPINFLEGSWFLIVSVIWNQATRINKRNLQQRIQWAPGTYLEHSSWFKCFRSNGKFATTNVTLDTSESYELWINPKTACNLSGVDYIFALEWLFFLNWIVASPIWFVNTSNYLNFKKFDFLWSMFGFFRVWKFIFSTTKTDIWFDLNVLWVNSVWASLNFSSIVSVECEELISIIQHKNWMLILYKTKTWEYKIDFFSMENEELNDTGYIITKEYTDSGLIKVKQARELKIFCDKLKDNEYIKIYASINNGEFEEVKTLTKDDRWKAGAFNILNFNREFHKIVFKLEIKWDFKLYDFIFINT